SYYFFGGTRGSARWDCQSVEIPITHNAHVCNGRTYSFTVRNMQRNDLAAPQQRISGQVRAGDVIRGLVMANQVETFGCPNPRPPPAQPRRSVIASRKPFDFASFLRALTIQRDGTSGPLRQHAPPITTCARSQWSLAEAVNGFTYCSSNLRRNNLVCRAA